MRKVYLSFLGLGSYDKENKKNFYQPTVYELDGRKSGNTEFVQVAELELLGATDFDVILIAATQKSHDTHFVNNLQGQLKRLGVVAFPIILTEDMTPESQWKWFETLLAHIEPGDELTVDLTHGYRSIPIIFSAAINFLQKARNIRLNGVYYGAFDKDRELAPIIDMKAFYNINEWADAVSRLVDDADARKMAEVAEQTTDFQAGELNDKEVISTFDDLTNTIRNVDVNNVAKKANEAILLVRKRKETASETGKILLDLVIKKFASLRTRMPPSGKYDKDYFAVQLEIIKLLLEHRLFMQAYTVMREFVASVGMIPVDKAKISNQDGRKKRYRFAEVFVSMIQIEKEKWKFEDLRKKDSDTLMPYYEKLEKIGIGPLLKGFAKKLIQYRNGFDHAWTSKPGANVEIEKFGNECFDKLKEVARLLEENGFLR